MIQLINGRDEESLIIITAILLGFFISFICPLVWTYNLNYSKNENFRQSSQNFTKPSWIFQNSKYSLGGDRFFPGSTSLARQLLCYGPPNNESGPDIVNLSDSVKNSCLRRKYADEEQKRFLTKDNKNLLNELDFESEFDSMDLESDNEEDVFFGDSLRNLKIRLEFRLNARKEAKDLEDVKTMAKMLGTLDQIKKLTSNWSATDFCISLTVRVLIQARYPLFSHWIDANIEKVYKRPYVSLDLKRFNQELLFLFKEEGLDKKIGKQKPRLTSDFWFFIFQFIILNYDNAVIEKKPIVLYNKIRTDFIELLRLNNCLEEEEKSDILVGLRSCLRNNLRTDFFLAEEKSLDFKRFLWETEILFHSMSISNIFNKNRVIVKQKENLTLNTELLTPSQVEEQKKQKEQEFTFYRESLLLSFKMCGIPRDQSLRVIEEALTTKNKNLLLDKLREYRY